MNPSNEKENNIVKWRITVATSAWQEWKCVSMCYVSMHVSLWQPLRWHLHEPLRHPLPSTGGEVGAPPRITVGEEGDVAPTPPPRSYRSGSRASLGFDSSLLGTPCMCLPFSALLSWHSLSPSVIPTLPTVSPWPPLPFFRHSYIIFAFLIYR